MIKIEINKINGNPIKRYYSETHYIKKVGSEDLVNEIVVGVDEDIEVIETDIEFEIIENEEFKNIEY
jgi:hypothetical protein